MKFTIKILIGSVVLLFGCRAIPNDYHAVKGKIPDNKTQKCIKLYDDIYKKWAINDTIDNCYYYNEKLIESIEKNKHCFIGMDTSEVVLLFGKYSYKYKLSYDRVIKYFFSKQCIYNSFYASEHELLFEYDKKGKITDIFYNHNVVLE